MNEEYLNLMTEIDEGWGITNYVDLMERLEEGESPTNFTGGTGKTLREDKFGRISMRDFFEGNNGSGAFNGVALTVDELEEIVTDVAKEGYEDSWMETTSGNTYNYSGYLERDINYTLYENEVLDYSVALIAVHVGLDIRGGYTAAVAFKYDDEYALMEDLASWYYIGGASFKVEGEEYTLSVSATPGADWLQVYISDSNNSESFAYDEETTTLDMYDREDFKESLAEFFEESNIEVDEGSLTIDK